MGLEKRRVPIHIRYILHADGIPVEVCYENQLVETDESGKETIAVLGVETENSAPPELIARCLGDGLALSRQEEQRALAAEAAANARADAADQARQEAMDLMASHKASADARCARAQAAVDDLAQQLAAAQAEIARLTAAAAAQVEGE